MPQKNIYIYYVSTPFGVVFLRWHNFPWTCSLSKKYFSKCLGLHKVLIIAFLQKLKTITNFQTNFRKCRRKSDFFYTFVLSLTSISVFRIFQSNQIKSKSNPFFNPDFGADLKFWKSGGFDLDLIWTPSDFKLKSKSFFWNN